MAPPRAATVLHSYLPYAQQALEGGAPATSAMEAVTSTRGGSSAVAAAAAPAKGAASQELVEARASPQMGPSAAGLGHQGLALSKGTKRARGDKDGGLEHSSGSSSCTCDGAEATDDVASSKLPPTTGFQPFAYPSKLQRFSSLEPLQHTSSEVTTETCIPTHAPTPPSCSGLARCSSDAMMTPPPRKMPCAAGYTDGMAMECPGAPIKQRRQMPRASPSRMATLMRPLNFSVCT